MNDLTAVGGEANLRFSSSELPLVTCRACIEIDQFSSSRGKTATFTDLRRLAKALSGPNLPPLDPFDSKSSAFDPNAAIIITRALAIVDPGLAEGPLAGLNKIAGEIFDAIVAFVAQPTDFAEKRSDELGRIRSFCLALSQSFLSADSADFYFGNRSFAHF